MTPRKFLTVQDVVEATGQHRTTVVRLIAQGRIPACRLGRRILIDPDFLENLISKVPITAGGV